MPTQGNEIRNISQTAQEREIVKLAPDLLVYLEGTPYLVNWFINDPATKNQYSLVNINDYVTSFNAGYDVDNLIPSASIQLQVPNTDKHLFVMPGGNNLIQTMMQVQVFAKGYYFGNDGSTLLRRVFKGVVAHIAYSDDGKMLQISVQCYGTLHFMEVMMVDVSPAIISSSPQSVVPFKTNLAYCNPYLQLLDMFVRATSTAGFYINSLSGAEKGGGNVSSGDYSTAVNDGYVVKWQQILANIRNDVHIYGFTYKDDPTIVGQTQDSPVNGQVDHNTKAAIYDRYLKKTEAQQLADFSQVNSTNGGSPYPAIRQYLPDMEVSGIQLLNGKFISRLDEIRQIVHLILYEGYQDVDGKIIFKPPLYNLDVTNIGSETDTTSSAGSGTLGSNNTSPGSTTTTTSNTASNPITELNSNNNPFVIYLSEIIQENETEDEAAIRTTRMTVQGNWEPSFQFTSHNELLDTVEYIDIPKLQKFGLREEPTKQVGWFKDGDKFGLFSYAAAETVRANRGYRTYTVTIPMRPELKLGFPCFIPHRDMYGYIKNIQLSYTQGGTATMQVTLDTIRRRPLLPTQHTDNQGKTSQIFESQPNLVWRWTSAPAPTTAAQAPVQTTSVTAPQGNTLTTGNQGATANSQSSTAGQTNNPANIVGTVGSLPLTPDLLPTPQQHSDIMVQRQNVANTWGTEPDTKGASFRIQNDTFSSWTPPAKGSAAGTQGVYPTTTSGTGIFTTQRIVDQVYYHDIRRTMPFTDDKGYEVVTPFPWGRWVSVRQAIKEFTQNGYIVPSQVTQVNDAYVPPSSVQAFLAAGLATPNIAGDTVAQLNTLLSNLQQSTEDDTIIVLSYSNTSQSDSSLTLNPQPDLGQAEAQLENTITTQQQAIDVLVSGSIAPTKSAQQALATAKTPSPTQNIGLTPAPSTAPADTIPVTTTGNNGQS